MQILCLSKNRHSFSLIFLLFSLLYGHLNEISGSSIHVYRNFVRRNSTCFFAIYHLIFRVLHFSSGFFPFNGVTLSQILDAYMFVDRERLRSFIYSTQDRELGGFGKFGDVVPGMLKFSS